jgi:hypothetical protein
MVAGAAGAALATGTVFAAGAAAEAPAEAFMEDAAEALIAAGTSSTFTAGSAGAGSGLAYRIAESGYRLNIPRMFAALLLLSLAGIVIFYLLSLINYLALRRWHESALEAER